MMMIWDLGFGISDVASRHSGWVSSVQSAVRDPQSEIPLLAWRPLLDPAPIDGYWLWFLPPLILIVAIVYRTIKSESLMSVPRRSVYLAFQIGVFIVAITLILWVVLRLV